MSVPEGMQSKLRTLQRRVEQLERAVRTESVLMVRSIGWNVAASALGLLAHSYSGTGARDTRTLETLFNRVIIAILDEKPVRGCSRCAGPMVQTNGVMLCLECAKHEELESL